MKTSVVADSGFGGEVVEVKEREPRDLDASRRKEVVGLV